MNPQSVQQVHRQYHPQAQLPRYGPTGGPEGDGYPSYLSMDSGAPSRPGQQQPQQLQAEESEEAEGGRTEGLLRSRKAVLPSEIRRRERSTEDPRRGRGDEEVVTTRVQAEREHPERRGHRSRARWEETAEPSRHTEHTHTHLQAADTRPRGRDNAIYIHKGVAAAHIQPRAAQVSSGSSNTAANRPASDPVGPCQRKLQHQIQDPQEVRKSDSISNGESHQDSRVTVARLRHSYLESTTPPTSRRAEL